MHQVGETTLDLEDRWFCPEWRDLIHKPREVCNLGLSRGIFCSGVEQINTEYCVCPLELLARRRGSCSEHSMFDGLLSAANNAIEPLP